MATRGWGGFRDRAARCHRSGTADRRGACANEAISAAVAEAIETAAGLSVAYFSALSGVIENGGGRMARNELAAMLGWHRPQFPRRHLRMSVDSFSERPALPVDA